MASRPNVKEVNDRRQDSDTGGNRVKGRRKIWGGKTKQRYDRVMIVRQQSVLVI